MNLLKVTVDIDAADEDPTKYKLHVFSGQGIASNKSVEENVITATYFYKNFCVMIANFGVYKGFGVVNDEFKQSLEYE